MSKNSGNMQNTISSKIIGIQFSILSPEEIEKMSVAEITNKETYINYKFLKLLNRRTRCTRKF